MSAELVLFYVPVPSKESGLKLAKGLLQENLIACANLMPPHLALYKWDGELQEDSEHIMILKTTAAAAHKVEALLTERHPYDCPCILQITPSKTSQAFLDWANQQTAARS